MIVLRRRACRANRTRGGGFRVSDGVAQLVGAATAPAHRRRGVQSALLRARLADAAEAGCDIAVVTTAPGSSHSRTCNGRDFICSIPAPSLVKDTE
jgi:ribosomal protein S18 acetylase RimI-like enzyme